MNLKLLKYTLILLCIVVIVKSTPDVSDFTYYFDDNSVLNDKIMPSTTPEANEMFYGTYYFNDGSTILSDPRNGIMINPINKV